MFSSNSYGLPSSITVTGTPYRLFGSKLKNERRRFPGSVATHAGVFSRKGYPKSNGSWPLFAGG